MRSIHLVRPCDFSGSETKRSIPKRWERNLAMSCPLTLFPALSNGGAKVPNPRRFMSNMGSRGLGGSLRFDDSVGGELLPEVDLLADGRHELLGRSTRRSNSVSRELLRCVLERQRLVGGLVDLVDDRARQPLWRNQTVPQVYLVAGQACLGNRGNVRQCR